ncbi:MAG TPA: hypothetical protein VGW38_09770, partial [Chloroflexota bacterium]|nr:hypothetical protein [Chloroflexota bacterium]
LVPFRNVDALRAAIRFCLDEPREAANRGAKLRQSARVRFSPQAASTAERGIAGLLRVHGAATKAP